MNHPKWTLDAEENMLLLWRSTFGSNPRIPERDISLLIIADFGWDRTYEIFYDAMLKGFHRITTLQDALDDKGNIRPKDKDEGYQPATSKKCVLCGKQTSNEYCGKPACNYSEYIKWSTE